MKKTIASILFITIIALTTVVSAFSVGVSANKVEVSQGEEVAVIVSWDEDVYATDITLKYDSAVFDFVSASKGLANDKTPGTIYLSFAEVSPIKSITFTFKAKTAGAAASFRLEGATFGNLSGELTPSYNNNAISVDVKAVDPVDKENENTNNNTESNTNSNTNNNTSTKPTKLPQTGVNYVAYISVGAIIIAIIIMAKVVKSKKV